MRANAAVLTAILLCCALMTGCGGGGGNTITTPVITWTTPAPITYGTALSATQLDATASMPGTFVYTPATGTVLAAGTQTLSVTFTPANTTYMAVTATVSLTVNEATPVVTWATPAAIVYGTALSATQLNATASIPGTFVFTPAAGTVLSAGSQTLSVTFTPTNTTDYTTATSTVTLAVDPTAPTTSTTAAQNGAVIVSLADATPAATIYYTVDGSTPTSSSQPYLAPFLVASNLTLKAIATATGTSSTVTSQSFSPNIPSGTLVWSDEFSNATGVPAQPNPAIWTYDTGGGGFGNNELENYCGWGSNTSPCSTALPSEYVGTDGYLHIEAQQPSTGVYTSARLKTQGLFSFQYGRIEFRAQVPEAQGFWPANWLLGNNINTVNWPACGEQDVLERVNAAATPDWNEGSIHGTGFTGGTGLGTQYDFPSGQTAGSAFHTYGMIWSPGSVAYYVDDPASPYITYTTSSLSGLSGAVWPFDAGQSNFIILNLAIGGDYPGPPDSSTPFPSEMLVDYVRIYTN
jgi:beta-glucanase (GH16 family)